MVMYKSIRPKRFVVRLLEKFQETGEYTEAAETKDLMWLQSALYVHRENFRF